MANNLNIKNTNNELRNISLDISRIIVKIIMQECELEKTKKTLGFKKQRLLTKTLCNNYTSSNTDQLY